MSQYSDCNRKDCQLVAEMKRLEEEKVAYYENLIDEMDKEETERLKRWMKMLKELPSYKNTVQIIYEIQVRLDELGESDETIY